MTKQAKKYQELKIELEDILQKLESDSIDVDEALELHKKAKQNIKEIENHLKKVKAQIDIDKPKK